MAIVNTIPKLISTKMLMVLQKDLVGDKICTIDTGSQIKKEGDTVSFPGLAKPTIADYTGTLTYESLADASVTLLIDQKKSYAFKVDDIENFQSTIDLKGTSTEEAAYGLRDEADKYIFGLHAGAGTTVTATVSATIALSTIATVIRKLAEANVKAGQRWMVIPPWLEEKLTLAGVKFQIKNGTEGGSVSWVKYLDTDIYVSNNIVTTGAEGSYNSKCLAGSYNSIVFAKQIVKSRFIPELEASFAGGASGLMVYGAKVLKPAELVLLNATQSAAESSI